MRRGFTLLEMMIAIVIFSLITVFLYRSLDSLRDSMHFYGERLDLQQHQTRIMKTIFLDLAQSESNATKIINDERQLDTLLMQTSHSVHRRVMPYVGYTVRNGVLYRFESAQPPATPPEPTEYMIVDRLEPVETFRIYANKSHFLVDLRFKGSSEQLMKIPRSGVKPDVNMDDNASGSTVDSDATSDSNASESAVL